MKTKVVLTLSIVFVLGLVFSASAQMRAGSPEDKAFQAIENEKDPDAKIKLLLDFEKQFGAESKMMPAVYSMLMDVYSGKKDPAHVNEYGEKVIKADPENTEALMTVSRSYAMGRTNLDKAVSYAQRAVDSVAKKRTSSPPPGYSDADWKAYLDSLEKSAQSLLLYAKSVKP